MRLMKENHTVKIKYVTIFDYIDKILIVLSATSSGVSIISFTSIIGVPAGIASTCFTLIFSITAGILEKITKYNNKEKERARSNTYAGKK